MPLSVNVSVCASAWALSAGLSGLSRALAFAGCAVVDFSGFDGFAVCGEKYLRLLRRSFPERVGKETPCDRHDFTFGGGTARATKSVSVTLSMQGLCDSQIEVLVVSGALPCLLGRQFTEVGRGRSAMSVDFPCGDVYVRTDTGRALVGVNGPSGVLLLSLIGELRPNLTRSKPSQGTPLVLATSAVGTRMVYEAVTPIPVGTPGEQLGTPGNSNEPAAVTPPDTVAGTPNVNAAVTPPVPAEVTPPVNENASGSDAVVDGKHPSADRQKDEAPSNADCVQADGEWQVASGRKACKHGPKRADDGVADNSGEVFARARRIGEVRSDCGPDTLPADGEAGAEVSQKTTTGDNDSEPSPPQLPPALRKTTKQLIHLHRAGHRDVGSFERFIRAQLSSSLARKHTVDLARLVDRYRDVVDGCHACMRRTKPSDNRSHGTIIPIRRLLGERLWMDTLSLRNGHGYCTLVLDEASGDCALCYHATRESQDTADAIFCGWIRMHGAAPEGGVVVCDRAPEYGAEVIALFEMFGYAMSPTPALSSDSHGRVERRLRELRAAVGAINGEHEPPASSASWAIRLAAVEMELRSIVDGSGTTSAQRAFGVSPSLWAYGHNPDVELDGAAVELRRIAEDAREAVFKARCKASAQRLAHEKPREEPREFAVGEVVLFRRDGAWVGPGVITGIVRASALDPASTGVEYRVARGPVDYSVHPMDMKGACPRAVLTEPELAQAWTRLGTAARLDVPDESVPKVAGGEPQVADPELLLDAGRETQELHGLEAKVRAQLRDPSRWPKPRGRPRKSVHPVVEVKVPNSMKKVERIRRVRFVPGTKPASNRGKSVRDLAVRKGKAQVKSKQAKIRVKPKPKTKPKPKSPAVRRPAIRGKKVKALAMLFEPADSGEPQESESESPEPQVVASASSSPARQPESSSPVRCRTEHFQLFGDTDSTHRADLESQADEDLSVAFETANAAMQFSAYSALSSAQFDAQENSRGYHAFAAAEEYTTEYAFSLADVSAEEKERALNKGLADYVGCVVDEKVSPDQVHLTRSGVRDLCTRMHWEYELLMAHWVRKVKLIFETDASGAKSAQPTLGARYRWTPHPDGHREQSLTAAEVSAPTCSVAVQRLVMQLGMHLGMRRLLLDLGSAFFTSDKKADLATDKLAHTHTFVMEPPEARPLALRGTATFRELLVAVPGTREAPAHFYRTLAKFLVEHGFYRSKYDLCLFVKYRSDGVKRSPPEIDAILVWHVDDSHAWLSPRLEQSFLSDLLKQRFMRGVKEQVVEHGEWAVFTGVESMENEDGMLLRQSAYAQHKLHEIPDVPERCKQTVRERLVTDDERSALKSLVGGLRWFTRTSLEIARSVSRLSSWMSSPECTLEQLQRANKLVRYIKLYPDRCTIFLPRLPAGYHLKATVISDAGEPPYDAIFRGRWFGCYAVGLQVRTTRDDPNSLLFSLVTLRAGLTRKVSGSSLDGECNTLAEGGTVGLVIGDVCSEVLSGPTYTHLESIVMNVPDDRNVVRVLMSPHTDSNDIVTGYRNALQQPGIEKRRQTDLFQFKEWGAQGLLEPVSEDPGGEVIYIAGISNPCDAGTKDQSWESGTFQSFRALLHGQFSLDTRPPRVKTHANFAVFG